MFGRSLRKHARFNNFFLHWTMPAGIFLSFRFDERHCKCLCKGDVFNWWSIQLYQLSCWIVRLYNWSNVCYLYWIVFRRVIFVGRSKQLHILSCWNIRLHSWSDFSHLYWVMFCRILLSLRFNERHCTFMS